MPTTVFTHLAAALLPVLILVIFIFVRRMRQNKQYIKDFWSSQNSRTAGWGWFDGDEDLPAALRHDPGRRIGGRQRADPGFCP